MNTKAAKLDAVMLSRDQAVKIMAVAALLKDGDLSLAGEDAMPAHDGLCDIGEEIALQLAGYPE